MLHVFPFIGEELVLPCSALKRSVGQEVSSQISVVGSCVAHQDRLHYAEALQTNILDRR